MSYRPRDLAVVVWLLALVDVGLRRLGHWRRGRHSWWSTRRSATVREKGLGLAWRIAEGRCVCCGIETEDFEAIAEGVRMRREYASTLRMPKTSSVQVMWHGGTR